MSAPITTVDMMLAVAATAGTASDGDAAGTDTDATPDAVGEVRVEVGVSGAAVGMAAGGWNPAAEVAAVGAAKPAAPTSGTADDGIFVVADDGPSGPAGWSCVVVADDAEGVAAAGAVGAGSVAGAGAGAPTA